MNLKSFYSLCKSVDFFHDVLWRKTIANHVTPKAQATHSVVYVNPIDFILITHVPERTRGSTERVFNEIIKTVRPLRITLLNVIPSCRRGPSHTRSIRFRVLTRPAYVWRRRVWNAFRIYCPYSTARRDGTLCDRYSVFVARGVRTNFE